MLAAAVILHTINRSGTTVDSAALPDIWLPGLWDGLSFVIEGVFFAAVEKKESFWNVNHGVAVRAARFQY